jgi:hypothetical protein
MEFEILPEAEDDGTCVLAAIEQLRDDGVRVDVVLPWRGTLAGEGDLGARLLRMLENTGFSGFATVGVERFEFSEGVLRIAQWEHRYARLELQISPDPGYETASVVKVLLELSKRADVADLDASHQQGGVHVLTSVQDPEVFLKAVHGALVESGFRGMAILGVQGRWRFGEDGPVRLDQGVPV